MEVAVNGPVMSPLHGLAIMPVRRRSMPSARRRHRGPAFWPLACLLALALIPLLAAGSANAGDGTAPAASPPPGTDSEAHSDTGPVDGSVGSAAAAPTPVMKADSVSAAPAIRDSVVKTAGAPAKEPEPAEHIENASTPSAEPADSPRIVPGAAAAPKPTASKVSVPNAGTKTKATRGLRGSARRTIARSPGARRRGGDAPRTATARPPAAHETFTEADRVSTELERTERFVGRAQKSIVLSKNTRAIKLFTSALDFQSDSREAYKVRQYARAERLTLASRDFADRASRMVGPPREDPDYVEHVLRRTDDALDRAKDVLKTGAGRDAWNQHEALKDEQKDAWKVFKSGDVGSAYKQTLGVREGVLALLRQLQDLPVPRETAEKAIGGAEAALEQANRELGPKPTIEAMRLVRLANEYLAKARQSFNHGSYRSALLQAKVVERHVEHAVDVGRPGSG